MSDREIVVAIHDLNPYGGQDRSTLEIVEQLGRRRQVAVHSFSYQPGRPQGSIRFRPIRPGFRKPALLKIMLYHLVTAARFLGLRIRRRDAVICATGACSLVSDVVHVQFVHASWARRREPGGSLYHRVVAIYNRVTEKLTFRPRKTYIAISAGVKEELEREYGLSRVAVVHHGVDSAKFAPCASRAEKASLRARLGLATDRELVFLYVGTYERKGLATVIRALPLLPPELAARVKIAAIGAGDAAKFGALARSLGVGEMLELIPPRKNIEEYFRAADAFVFPTTYEPFGLVILEAMASGLACVVSRVAGAAELIAHDRSGLLLDEATDERALATLMAKLHDDATRERLGKEARRTAEHRSWELVAREYESAIEKFLPRA